MTGSNIVIKNAFAGFIGASFILCNATSGAVNSEITQTVWCSDINSNNVRNLDVTNTSGFGNILYGSNTHNDSVFSVSDIKLNSVLEPFALKIDENNSASVLNILAYNGENMDVSALKVSVADLNDAASDANVKADSGADMLFIRTDLINIPNKILTPVGSKNVSNTDTDKSNAEKNEIIDAGSQVSPVNQINKDQGKEDVNKKSIEENDFPLTPVSDKNSEINNIEEKSMEKQVPVQNNEVKKGVNEELELDNVHEIKLKFSPKTEINTPLIPAAQETKDAIEQDVQTEEKIKNMADDKVDEITESSENKPNQNVIEKGEAVTEVKEEVKKYDENNLDKTNEAAPAIEEVKTYIDEAANTVKEDSAKKLNIVIPETNPVKVEFNNNVIFPEGKTEKEQPVSVKDVQYQKTDTLQTETKPENYPADFENIKTEQADDVKSQVPQVNSEALDIHHNENKESVAPVDTEINSANESTSEDVVDENVMPKYTGNELENEENIQQTVTPPARLKHMTNNFNSCDFPKQEEKVNGLLKTRNKVVKVIVGRDLALSARTKKLVAENFGEERNVGYGAIFVAQNRNNNSFNLDTSSDSIDFDGAEQTQSQDNTNEKEVTINTSQDIINAKNIVGTNINYVKDTNVLQRKYQVLTGSNLMINVTDKGKFDIFNDKVFNLVIDSKNDAKYFDTNYQLPPYEENIKKVEPKNTALPLPLIKEDGPNILSGSETGEDTQSDENPSDDENISPAGTKSVDKDELLNDEPKQAVEPKKTFFSKIFRKK